MAEAVAAIVARNGGTLMREAVSDLVAAFGKGNVLVVDNASSDSATKKLGVNMQRHETNLGYAAGANCALAWAAERGAKALLLFNQDARIDKQSVGRMLALLRSDANLGAVFAKVVRRDAPYILDGLYGRRNLRHKLTTSLGGGRVDSGKPDRPVAIEHGHGAALLLRVQAAQAVHGFDEHLLAYHDEVDLCWRLAQANWGAALEPRAVVRHVGTRNDPDRARAKAYLLARNSLRVARNNGGAPAWLRVAIWAAAATLVYYGPTALAGDNVSRALVRGWCDGLRARPIRDEILALL